MHQYYCWPNRYSFYEVCSNARDLVDLYQITEVGRQKSRLGSQIWLEANEHVIELTTDVDVCMTHQWYCPPCSRVVWYIKAPKPSQDTAMTPSTSSSQML